MAWTRPKVYPLFYISSEPAVSIMVDAVTAGGMYDWTKKQFLTPPSNFLTPLTKVAVPAIPGTLQRFTTTLDTSSFPDGQYAVYYCKPTGELLESWVEYFNVVDGSGYQVISVKAVTMQFN